MQIHINTDKNIEGNNRLLNFFTSEVEKDLERFGSIINRVEVFFGDENSEKEGKDDKRCVIEVRIAKKEPIAVSDYADTLEKAFYGALKKMKKKLQTTYEKIKEM